MKCITVSTNTASDRIYHLNIKKRKPYKTFNILKIEVNKTPTFRKHLTTSVKPSSENNKYIKF